MRLIVLLCMIVVAQAGRAQHVVSGRVVDAADGRRLVRATVALLNSADSTVVRGTYTDTTGRFKLDYDDGQHQLVRVSYVGYRTLVLSIPDAQGMNSVDLGDVAIGLADHEAVEVSANRDLIEYSANKKVFNVDQNVAAASSMAIDVLKQVPTVNVDQEGNITVRGASSVNIQIDGKPISAYGNPTQVLQSLPARTLEKVEVITNPGAKYDAQGQSGILNIVLKKLNTDGVNGMVTAATGLYDMYALSATGNARQGALNVNLSGDYSSNRHIRYKQSDTWFEDNTYINRFGPSYSKGKGGGLRLGADLRLSDMRTVSISGDYRQYVGSAYDPFYTSRYTTSNGVVDATYTTLIPNGLNVFENGGVYVDYAESFADKRQRLTGSAYFMPSYFDVRNTLEMSNSYNDFEPFGKPIDGRSVQMVGTSFTSQSQLDYALPIGDVTTIETGAKVVTQHIDSDFNFDRLDSAGAYHRDPTGSNSAKHQDNVYAAYFNLNSSIDAFKYQLGLRSEITTNFFANVNSPSSNLDRTYWGLFPSASCSYELSPATSIQASYSRRINRPHATQINPFLDKSDSLNWRTGNPNLLPEYTHAFETGIAHSFDNVFLSAEGFYRLTDNAINLRFREQVAPNVILEKPYNFGNGRSYGINTFLNASVFDWLRMNGEFSYYFQQSKGEFRGSDFNSAAYGWNARIIMMATLPGAINMQVNYDYTAPQVIPQGKRYEFAIMSMSCNKSFVDDQLTVGLNWTDCLRTARFGGTVDSADFNTVLLNQRDYTLLSLNVSYRINNYRERRGQQPGAQSAGANSI